MDMNKQKDKITLMIVDDQAIFRLGLQMMLTQAEEISIVDTASNGADAVEKAIKLMPDIIIMDISMPGIDGIEATKAILSELPFCGIIALTAHDSPAVVSQVLDAGAKGFVPKDCSVDELVDAIKSVHDGSIYLCPRTAVSLVQNMYQRKPEIELLKTLSPRETEIVHMLSLGLNNKSIAWKLGLSVKTVETHRKQALAKLNIKNMADLARFAVNCGLAPLD